MKRMIALMNSFTPEEKDLAGNNRFGYLWAKADKFLILGPEKYRRGDFFGLPSEDWSEKELELVTDGCRQLSEGRGLSLEKPFKGLEAGGFYRLFELFHYEPTARKSSYLPDGGIVDKVTFKHVMDEGSVTYYNLVEY